jgi:hypothetical protein
VASGVAGVRFVEGGVVPSNLLSEVSGWRSSREVEYDAAVVSTPVGLTSRVSDVSIAKIDDESLKFFF